ncbi:MAG: hypothetical protein BGO49_02025 [Planctomycetales bacterium 71-10]|nr:MAG: hypothetical protein BGO49_02025 [Planctomycetales bacterium 71-10]
MPDSGEVRPWDVLVLATFAPLGASASVRLSPNLGPADLGVAASIPIPRGPGEFLVGVISDSPGPGSIPILLTTRRIIWFERIEPAPGADDRRPTLSGRAADYLDLGPEVVADGATVDLGMGRVVPLPPDGRRLAEALATALRALHRAATTGEAPEIAPALAERIAGAIPKALALDASLADAGSQRASFRDELLAASPRVYMTPAIVVACVAAWAAMVASGVPAGDPDSGDLLAWGANDAVRVAVQGEAWRLPASVFLHGGVLHLAVNMWALAGMGPLVERLYGPLRFAALYMAAGVGGALASTAIGPARTSVGASGAIFGVLGAILAFLLVRRRAIPPSVLKPLRSQSLGFVIFNVAFGAAVPTIDQAAHLGGLATGFLAGLALAPPWPRRGTSAAGLARSIFAIAAVATAVVAACAGVVRWRAGTITPRDLYRDFAIQAAPVQERLIRTVHDLADVAGEIEAAGGESTRADLAARLADQEREGRANLVAFDALRIPDPRLREFADRMADAQREQVAAVEAARRYVRSGDRRDLEGPGGFIRCAEAMKRLRQAAGRLHEGYLRDNGLIEPADRP